ncbi:hypothetical protein SETIT_4G107700v2 [Setaria italica]|uniref:Uncharacterized protein n=1 Tax=Setaria italica TaxID=4555 RepID=A0A368QSY1_SETIT|nr:hypothetical protein SETIT_4G107700v2 [Setaria italica]
MLVAVWCTLAAVRSPPPILSLRASFGSLGMCAMNSFFVCTGVGFKLLPWCSSFPFSAEAEHQAEVAPTSDDKDDPEDLKRVSM